MNSVRIRKIFSAFIAAGTLLAGTLAGASELCARTFNVFLLTGQSNSLGAIKGNFADAEKLSPPPSQVRFWHGNFGGYCTGADSVAWENVAPQRESQIVFGPEFGFARALENDIAKKCGLDPRTCGILKVSRDGGGNAHWLAPDGDAYREILATARRAFAALPVAGFDSVEIQAILYLQGESDSAEEILLAGTRVAALRENLRRDFEAMNVSGIEKISASRAALLIGEPATFHGKDRVASDGSTSAQRLKNAAENLPRAAWVPTRDLPKIRFGDSLGVHYDGNAQLVIGRRFADAFFATGENGGGCMVYGGVSKSGRGVFGE